MFHMGNIKGTKETPKLVVSKFLHFELSEIDLLYLHFNESKSYIDLLFSSVNLGIRLICHSNNNMCNFISGSI